MTAGPHDAGQPQWALARTYTFSLRRTWQLLSAPSSFFRTGKDMPKIVQLIWESL